MWIDKFWTTPSPTTVPCYKTNYKNIATKREVTFVSIWNVWYQKYFTSTSRGRHVKSCQGFSHVGVALWKTTENERCTEFLLQKYFVVWWECEAYINRHRWSPLKKNPERSGMERNGTASNCAQYRRGRRICNGKLLICQLIRAHFVSCTRQEDRKTGQVPSRRYRATPNVLNILDV